jgi:hypothetical protein
MEKENIKITKVVISIGDKEVSLKLEEARELYDVLAKLFNKPVAYYSCASYIRTSPNINWDYNKPYTKPYGESPNTTTWLIS